MIRDGKIWVGGTEDGGQAFLLPKMANRHGLIAGATGSGKTVTLKGLAESFSALGVPVFLADVKGDLAGMCRPGEVNENIRKRMQRIGMSGEEDIFTKYPVTFWDLYGERGIQLRTTISEMGPLILSRVLGLNELQSDLLSVAFRIADEQELLLVDIKDLKALLNDIDENRASFQADYGKISPASIAVIIRSLAALEGEGGNLFFGETALNIRDWFTTGTDGKGMIHILDSETLIQNGKLYSAFLLWLLSELFEQLPEVGDLEKPRMVFFFDEAHLLFRGTSQALLDKISQVVKLIRSMGVGIYFITQNPKDIPDGVLSQLGNKIQHALHAYTPAEQKGAKAAAMSFRENPAFDTYDTMLSLGIGEALVSVLDESGVPTMVERCRILPPQSKMGPLDDATRSQEITNNLLYVRYKDFVDRDSAYEFLQRKSASDAEAAAKQAEELAARKEAEKQAATNRAVKSVANSAAGTIGREVGNTLGSSIGGKFGKKLGGNIGASLGRGILNTFLKF